MKSGVQVGITVLFILWLGCWTAYASEYGGQEGEVDQTNVLLEELNFDEIQNFLNGNTISGQAPLSFKKMLADLMQGDFMGVSRQLMTAVKTALLGEIGENGRLMGQILMIGLIGAVFANFSGIFSGSQISETGFYVTYLLLFTFLSASFYTCIGIAKDVLSTIVEFMRALLPAYFLAVSFAGGSLTSAAGYGWMLFSISAVEWLVTVLFLPAVRIYTLFVLAGHMMKENVFSKITDLMEAGLRWGLKTTAGLVLGFHLLQSMVIPYADSLKNTSVQRFISMIPGVGQGAAAISQLVLGSGVLLKNTIGAGGVLVLAGVCIIPLIKLSVLLLFYRLSAALLEPICDKRMVSCINAVGTGCQLLLRMVMTAMILFGVSLAVVCMAANVTYYAG